MKELDLATLVAVLQELLGPWLWAGLAAAVAATAAFLYVLVRDRGLVSARLVWSEVAGLAGGAAAVLILQAVTNSGFGDIGGPIDWVLVGLVFLAGAIGAIVGTYALLGLLAGLRAGRRHGEAPAARAGAQGLGPLPRRAV